MSPDTVREAEARFCACCRSCQSAPAAVLQCFAGAVSVGGYLLPAAGNPLLTLACAVVSFFVKSCTPALPLHPVRRYRAIRNIRRLLKTARSLLNEEEKEARYRQIEADWFWAEGLHAEPALLTVSKALETRLPVSFLLFCGTFRCRPLHLVYYFMERLAAEAEANDTDGPAYRFLVQCRGQCHPPLNN